MRFHVVGLPHTHVTAEFSSCAFTNKVFYFCRMMCDLGHEVFLYAGPKSDAPCTEFIPCVEGWERDAYVRQFGHYTEAPWSGELWDKFNARAGDAISRRIEPQDFVCIIGGSAHQAIHDAFDKTHPVVEFGIGYGGCFAKYKVFESYAWMHTIYGARSMNNPTQVDGQWFDAVIPGYLDPEMFPAGEGRDRHVAPNGVRGPRGLRGPKGPDKDGYSPPWGPAEIEADMAHERVLAAAYDRGEYFLYVGRLIDRKGWRIAQDVCERMGKRLVVAGPGEFSGYGEYVGVVGPEERARLMGGATALFAPTIYIEPFGNVAVEAQACGTPVISSDWGAFTETVKPDITGYRCRSLAEFKEAVDKVPTLSRSLIRSHALAHYGLDVVGKQYEQYFKRLLTLWGDGWYHEPK